MRPAEALERVIPRIVEVGDSYDFVDSVEVANLKPGCAFGSGLFGVPHSLLFSCGER
jgi:hypothetical protein